MNDRTQVMDDTLLVLHGLAIRKAGGPAQVATVLGMDPATVADRLEAATADGDVIGAKGRFMLTPAGRAKLDAAYPEVYAAARADADLATAYERFEVVNRRLLDLFTRWQTVERGGEQIPNDHTDARYDAAIVDELGDQLERAEPVLAPFARTEPRIGVHQQRLDAAYDRVLAGDHDHVSGARIDSVHTVWFELHEDLLRMLGRTRDDT